MTLSVGDQAPDFTLNDGDRHPVSLASFRGQKAALVVFYPFAFSGGCTKELCAVRDELQDFQNETVQILAISCDPAPTLKAWADAQGYRFPLLSDFWPHGAVAQAYGCFNETAGMAVRGTYLIDTEGVVRFAEVNQPGEIRDQDAWRRALAELQGAGAGA